MGLRPHPPHRPLDPGDARLPPAPRSLRIVEGGLLPGTSRGFTGQGPAGDAARRLSSCGATRGGAWIHVNVNPMTELRPNPIRSDTSRRGTAGAPAGDSDAARRCPAEAGRDVSDDPAARTLLLRAAPARLGWRSVRLRSPNAHPGRGPLHPILREEDRDRQHPRCLPSIELPSPDTRELSPATQGSRPASSGWQGILPRLLPACGERTAPFAGFALPDGF
jgi:hypothetical protein